MKNKIGWGFLGAGNMILKLLIMLILIFSNLPAAVSADTVSGTALISGTAAGQKANIVNNSGFEDYNGDLPDGWKIDIYDTSDGAAKVVVEKGEAFEGDSYLTIYNNKPNVSGAYQEITVLPDTVYKVSCMLRTSDIKNISGAAGIWLYYGDTGNGIYTSEEFHDTGGEWKPLIFYIRTIKDKNKLYIHVALGGIGTKNEGSVSFDDIRMEEAIQYAPETAIRQFYIPPEKNMDNITGIDSKNTENSNRYVLIICIAMFLLIIIIIELLISSRLKKNNKYIENNNLS